MLPNEMFKDGVVQHLLEQQSFHKVSTLTKVCASREDTVVHLTFTRCGGAQETKVEKKQRLTEEEAI